MFRIGCHLSSAGGYMAMAQTAESIGANVFQFFTRNPRGGAAKPVDPRDAAAFASFAAERGMGPALAHAPYTLNAASSETRIRTFVESTMSDDLRRLELVPGAMYNLHPGSHVGQGAEKGVELISEMLAKILSGFDAPPSTTVLLETMAGKGTEVGRTFEELRAIIDRTSGLLGVSAEDFNMGVCLDTCHVWDGGYDVVDDLDGVLAEFDRVLGMKRLKAVHLNDSMNVRSSHKDHHACIGKGRIGLDALARAVNHPLLRELPFYLETPNDLDGYRAEIALLKSLRA